MKALEIENSIKNELAPAYLLIGTDEYLKMYVKNILLSTIPLEDRLFSYVNIDADSDKSIMGAIVAADTFSFSVCKKMVDVYPFSYKLTKDEEKSLENYLQSPSDTSFILFEGSEKNETCLSKYCVVIDCNKASEEDLCKYIINKLKDEQYDMKQYDIRQFVRYCNYDFGKIVNEMEKLKLYKLEEKVIELKDVESLVPPDLEVKSFELTNNLNKGDYQKALNILTSLREKGTESSVLFAMLSTSYRKLFQIATTKANDDVIQSTLKMSYAAIDVNRRIIANNKTKNKKYTLNLKKAVEYMQKLEYKYKLSIIDPDTALNLAMDLLIAQN